MLPFGYYDLIETFPNRGCAICSLLQRDVDRLLDSILYEHVTSPAMHRAFRASRGLCREHGWRLTTFGNVLSIAVLYEATLDEILSVMDQTPPNGKRTLTRFLQPQPQQSELAEALAPTQPCVACKAERESEAQYISVLGEYINDDRIQAAFRESDGLCLAHFRQALRHTPHAEQLVSIQRDIWGRLQAELREFKRKYDQHVDEKIGAEGDSWLRAVAAISGRKI